MTKINTEGKAPVTALAVIKVDNGLPALIDSKAVKSQQDGIRVSLVQLDAMIHANAVQCLLHAEKHGDTSLMRRLLVDIIDAKSGYRRQGIIAWMREFSPMELKGSVITLSGVIGDERRPFRVAEANATPFTELASANELVAERPVFRDTLTAMIEKAVRDYRAAVDNTVIKPGQEPQAKDPKKPFYNGIHLDKMEEGFDKITLVLAELSTFPDAQKDVYQARKAMIAAKLSATEASRK